MKNTWKIKELQIWQKAEKEIEERFVQKQIRANVTFKQEVQDLKLQHSKLMRESQQMTRVILK